MIKTNIDEKFLLQKISCLSGVKREDIKKTFKALVTNIILELYNEIENTKRKELFSDTIEIQIPYLTDSLKVNIKQILAKNGLDIELKFKLEPTNYLIENIKKVFRNDKTDIVEDLKLEIFEGLTDILEKN